MESTPITTTTAQPQQNENSEKYEEFKASQRELKDKIWKQKEEMRNKRDELKD